MTCNKIEHITKSRTRVIEQYKSSTNFLAYLDVFLAQADEIEDVLCQLLDERWIDTAVGAQLDNIGAIVGQSRVIPDFDALPFFGFEGAIGAETFGDDGTPATGGIWLSEGTAEFTTGTLNDATYRIYIQAKIIKNQVDAASANEVISVLELIVPGVDIELTQGSVSGNGEIFFDDLLTDTEKLIVTRGDIVPRPAGVSYVYSDQLGLFA